eukprot:gene14543-14666_t
MKVEAHLLSSTGEASASGRQAVNAVNACIVELASAKADFDKFDCLRIHLMLAHPLAVRASRPARARFHAPTNTVFATTSIDYEKWIKEDWNSRIEALAEALFAAVNSVAKSRASVEERAALVEIVVEAAALAKASPPAVMHPLDFGAKSHSTDAAAFELPPSELLAYLADAPPEPTAEPSSFKLYLRREGRLAYHDAWIADDEIIEHWGLCGELGETRSHRLGIGSDPFALLKDLSRGPRANGFKPMAMSRHKGLILEKPIEGFGSAEDLELRHGLQAFLDEKLGWLGLGHCDGGSTGSGSMEVFCFVVDGALALETLRRELASTAFREVRPGSIGAAILDVASRSRTWVCRKQTT